MVKNELSMLIESVEKANQDRAETISKMRLELRQLESLQQEEIQRLKQFKIAEDVLKDGGLI